MTGSIENYANQLRFSVMTCLISSVSCPLATTFDLLKMELRNQQGKELDLQNLQDAYDLVYEELLGKVVPR